MSYRTCHNNEGKWNDIIEVEGFTDKIEGYQSPGTAEAVRVKFRHNDVI